MENQPDEVVEIVRELFCKYKDHNSLKILDLKSAIMAPPRASTPQDVEKILSDWKRPIHTVQLHDKNFQVPDDLKVTLLHRIMPKPFQEIMRARQERMDDMGRPYSQDYDRFEEDFFDAMEIRRMDEENSQNKGVHGLKSTDKTHDAPAREYDETDEVFWVDSGIPSVMALERKVDDAATKMTENKENQPRRGARDQEKENRRVLVAKVLVGTVEGLIFSVTALTSMMKGKRRLGWPTSGDWRSWRPGPFPGHNSTTMELVVPKAPKGKGKGKSVRRQGQRWKRQRFWVRNWCVGFTFWMARHASGTHPVRLELLPELGSQLQPFHVTSRGSQ